MKGKCRSRLTAGSLAACLCRIGVAVAAGAGFLQFQAVPTATPQAASERRTLLAQYCVTCPNRTLKTAGLSLETLDLADVSANAAIWETVALKLRSGSMPLAGRPRPDAATTGTFVASLETELDRAARAHPNPGRAVVHRLNRTEYANAVRDLLALDI